MDDQAQAPDSLARFRSYAGTYLGVGIDGCCWRISPTLSGWRLECCRLGGTWQDQGVHGSLSSAIRAARL